MNINSKIGRMAFATVVSCTVYGCKDKPDLPSPIVESKTIASATFVNPNANAPKKQDHVAAALASPKLVLIGDSIVHDNEQTVWKQISDGLTEQKLESLVTNRTKRGELVRDWIGDQFDSYVSNPNYNIIVLQGGVNDIMWWVMQSKPAARENIFRRLLNRFGEMVAKAEENKKVLVLVTVSPWKDKGPWDEEAQEYTERLNAWMKEQRSRKGVFVADIYSALLSKSEEDRMDPSYHGKDVQHPNEAGSKVIAETILKQLQQ